MFKLIIKNADGSIYWKEKFETTALLNRWLDEEKSRPYWKQEFTTEIQEIIRTQPEPSAEEIQRRQAIATLKARLIELDNLSDLTAAELKEMARKFFKLIKLKGLAD